MIEALVKYQTVDAKLKQIENELGKSEERKKAITARKYLEGVSELIAKLEQKASDLSVSYNNLAVKQASVNEQIAELNRSLEIVEDETGATFLLKKTDELYALLKSVEEETVKIETEMKNVMKEFKNVIDTCNKAKEQYAEYSKKFNEIKDTYKDEVASIKGELAELKKKVDPTLMEKYEKKRLDKILFPIVVPVSDNSCVCGMQVPLATMESLKAGNICECDNCRRIMYLKND
ncbi:MAG: hypothetical protein IJR66_00260 [Clostridia bacterium]|nr:hypothetical protein [Clostridia bacterium]